MNAPSTIKLLEVTGIGGGLARAIRLCKRHGCASNKREGWEAAAKSGGGALVSLKRAADKEARAWYATATTVVATTGVATAVAMRLPLLTNEFWARCVCQGKEMHKDLLSAPPLLLRTAVFQRCQGHAQ